MIEKGEGFLVKLLEVKDGERTSLQYHNQREEVWITLKGEGVAEVGEEKVLLLPGVVVKVERGVKHRITGKHGLTILEVWLGEHLSEEDIVRLEDDYGRVPRY